MTSENPQTSRKLLYRLLGDLPPRRRKIAARTVCVERRPNYVLETLELNLNGIEPVPAYFVKPLERGKAVPAVLYNHAHGGNYALGKDELLRGHGEAFQDPPYAASIRICNNSLHRNDY